MRMLAFFSTMVMLVACAVDVSEEKGGGVRVSTGSDGGSETAGANYDPISSACPQFNEIGGNVQDYLTDKEWEILEEENYSAPGSSANYKFYNYRNPITKTSQVFGITADAAHAMATNNFVCSDVLHSKGNAKGLPTGEVSFGTFNTDKDYSSVDVGSNTQLVLVDADPGGQDIIGFFTYEKASGSNIRHRAGAEIFIGISNRNRNKVRHRTYTLSRVGEKSEIKTIRSDRLLAD